MAKFTPNLNLTKPDALDEMDVNVLNSNWDKIDKAYENAYIDHFKSLDADVSVAGTTTQTLFTFPLEANVVYLIEIDLHSSSTQQPSASTVKFMYNGGTAEDTTVSRGSWITFSSAVSTGAIQSSVPIQLTSTQANVVEPAEGIYFIKSTTAGTVDFVLTAPGGAVITIKSGSTASIRAAR
jgi:hypothetical protein